MRHELDGGSQGNREVARSERKKIIKGALKEFIPYGIGMLYAAAPFFYTGVLYNPQHKHAQQEPVAPEGSYEEVAPAESKAHIVFKGQDPDKRLGDIESIDVLQDPKGTYTLKFNYLKPEGEGAAQ